MKREKKELELLYEGKLLLIESTGTSAIEGESNYTEYGMEISGRDPRELHDHRGLIFPDSIGNHIQVYYDKGLKKSIIFDTVLNRWYK